MKRPTRKPAKPSPRKKRYSAPSLTVFGDLRQLTKSKGGVACDGGGKPMTRMALPNA
jgi:hypothetical protein